MALRLVFLGRLEDLAGGSERELVIDPPLSLDEITALLEPDLQAALADSKVRIALNGVLVSSEGFYAGDGDELAFLPPVSGG